MLKEKLEKAIFMVDEQDEYKDILTNMLTNCKVQNVK